MRRMTRDEMAFEILKNMIQPVNPFLPEGMAASAYAMADAMINEGLKYHLNDENKLRSKGKRREKA